VSSAPPTCWAGRGLVLALNGQTELVIFCGPARPYRVSQVIPLAEPVINMQAIVLASGFLTPCLPPISVLLAKFLVWPLSPGLK
jgi:hypothetical protein